MEKKTFAFRLADKAPKGDGKWQPREGVAMAACTEVQFMNYRDWRTGPDNGVFC
jgi:hypothetical protein